MQTHATLEGIGTFLIGRDAWGYSFGVNLTKVTGFWEYRTKNRWFIRFHGRGRSSLGRDAIDICIAGSKDEEVSLSREVQVMVELVANVWRNMATSAATAKGG